MLAGTDTAEGSSPIVFPAGCVELLDLVREDEVSALHVMHDNVIDIGKAPALFNDVVPAP